MQHLKGRKNISGKHQPAPDTELEFILRYSGFTERTSARDSHRGEAARDPLCPPQSNAGRFSLSYPVIISLALYCICSSVSLSHAYWGAQD